MPWVTEFPASFPLARTPNPMDAPPLRWGVLAPGRIAGSFVDALSRHTRQQVVAAGSRSLDRARAFADRFGIERAYSSYEQLVGDPDIDAVYVASPHSEHAAQALLAISAGKPVLVEKAFARNASEARQVVSAARAAGVLAMEAMWTRYLPQSDVIAQLLADGVLGEVVTVLADHGQSFDFDPNGRLFNPALAGGALLDLGVYPISFASFVLGNPDEIVATGDPDSHRGRCPGRHGAVHRGSAGLHQHHLAGQNPYDGVDLRHCGPPGDLGSVLRAGHDHPDRQRRTATGPRWGRDTGHHGCASRRPISPR